MILIEENPRHEGLMTLRIRHILLMTATITPNGSPELARANPVDRLKDYVRALSYYLQFIDHPLYGIVFVENSNSDTGKLHSLVDSRTMSSRVEFIDNYGVHSYSGKGRAYGEFKLLDYAMEHSSMVREAGVVWKVTGRYIVKNLPKIIRSAPEFDVYCDMKNHPLRWMDMRLMAWQPQIYQILLSGIADELNERMGESIMREYLPQRVAQLKASGREIKFIQRFRNEPLVDGIRGSDNRNYSFGRNLAKFYVRTIARTFLPSYWI
jgi:hypothetical protein